jgi:hypothetical protein
VASWRIAVRGVTKQAENLVRGGDRLTRITWPCVVDTPRAAKGRGRSLARNRQRGVRRRTRRGMESQDGIGPGVSYSWSRIATWSDALKVRAGSRRWIRPAGSHRGGISEFAVLRQKCCGAARSSETSVSGGKHHEGIGGRKTADLRGGENP